MSWYYWELSTGFKLDARLPERLLWNCPFSIYPYLYAWVTHMHLGEEAFCPVVMPHRKIIWGSLLPAVFSSSFSVFSWSCWLRYTAYPAAPESTRTRNAFENKQNRKGWLLTMWQYDNRKWMVPAIYVRPLPTLGILDFQLEIITFSWGSGRRKCCLWDLSCLTLFSTLTGFLNEPHYSLSPLFSCIADSQASVFTVFCLFGRLFSWWMATVCQPNECAGSAERVAGQSCTWHFSPIRYLILAQ